MAERFSDRYIATAKVDQLRDELAAKRREIEERQRALVEELRTLEAQESVLALLRVQQSATNGHAPLREDSTPKIRKPVAKSPARSRTEGAPKPPKKQLKKPKDAITALLRESSPLSQKEIVDTLENEVEPMSGKTGRKTLTDTLWWMKKREEVDELDGLIALSAPEYEPKGPIAAIIYNSIQSLPGQTSTEIANSVTPQLLAAGVKDDREARKTTFRALFALYRRQHVIHKDAQERWHPGRE